MNNFFLSPFRVVVVDYNRSCRVNLSHYGCKTEKKEKTDREQSVQRAIAAGPTKPLSVVSNTFSLSIVSTFLV